MKLDRTQRRVNLAGGTDAARRQAQAALKAAGFDVVPLGHVGGKCDDGALTIQFAPTADPATVDQSRWADFQDGLLDAAPSDPVRPSAALLLVNIDHFKRVRTLLGAETAEDILREVGARLKLIVHAYDRSRRKKGGRKSRLLHVGGDEFTILVPDLDEGAAAAKLAGDLLHAISLPYENIASQVYLTGRVGIALYPLDGGDIATLVRHAGSVVHHESRQGRNSVKFYATGMAAVAAERFELEVELSRAVRDGELEVHYQPQFSLRTGAIVGAEALVRWRRPGLGLVPAEVFVAVAEDLGLIADLGTWVLTTATAECRKWQTSGYGMLHISINTSAYQFRRLDMREVVSAALAQTGLDPSCLVLEVTESLVLADVERTVATLTQLQHMGVRIALDDFGTGYSSMSYLKNFAIDSLKVDRSFVTGLPDDQGDLAVTEAIIRMAKALHLEVTAEGVETEEQRVCLAALGCDHYQGFLSSRPIQAEDFMRLLATRVG